MFSDLISSHSIIALIRFGSGKLRPLSQRRAVSVEIPLSSPATSELNLSARRLAVHSRPYFLTNAFRNSIPNHWDRGALKLPGFFGIEGLE